MGEGKRGKRARPRRGETNFQAARADERGEYGRTGRYKPFGQENTARKKSLTPLQTKIPIRLKLA